MRADKLGRKDKHALKERIGFKPEVNPIIKMVELMHRAITKPVLEDAMNDVRNHTEIKSKVKW
jgi:hypothetical protein